MFWTLDELLLLHRYTLGCEIWWIVMPVCGLGLASRTSGLHLTAFGFLKGWSLRLCF